MIEEQTITQLDRLKLYSMKASYIDQMQNPAMQELSYAERFGMSVEAELHGREQKRLERYLRAAKFPDKKACVEAINYSINRGLDQSMMAGLIQLAWSDRCQNIAITGNTGNGKTNIACALALQVIRRGSPALYYRFSGLLEDIEKCRGDGSLPALRKKLAKAKVIIVDDFAMCPLTVQGRQDFFEFIVDRDGSGSLIFTSQLPFEKWHEYVGEPTVADAIIDRLRNSTHFIKLSGGNMRQHYSQITQEAA